MGSMAWDDLGVSEAGSQRPSYDELLTVVRGVPALAARVALLETENGDLRAGNARRRSRTSSSNLRVSAWFSS